MLWRCAVLAGTQLIRSGSGSAGRRGGAAGAHRAAGTAASGENIQIKISQRKRYREWISARVLNMKFSLSSDTLPILTVPSVEYCHPVKETISDNCVVIFSKTSCSYCTMAKNIFRDMNVNYKAVELDMLEYGSQFQDALYKMTGERTVPRIFVNGTFIGGATDTHRLHKEGKLLPLVHQCYLKKKREFQ
ncbi:glutaredoxin 2 isoform X1 [Marmota flaviventris]|uniref:glutaredoxin 2 isoform X1 n=1 Tax=Marmota flaviventris TaxID=93162 RepID=UPI003A86866D